MLSPLHKLISDKHTRLIEICTWIFSKSGKFFQVARTLCALDNEVDWKILFECTIYYQFFKIISAVFFRSRTSQRPQSMFLRYRLMSFTSLIWENLKINIYIIFRICFYDEFLKLEIHLSHVFGFTLFYLAVTCNLHNPATQL